MDTVRQTQKKYGSRAMTVAILVGLVFIVIGVSFKFGAVPFHMWVPDVYHGAPTAVMLADYQSNELAGGFRTQAVTVTKGIAVFDAALLVETGSHADFDRLIVRNCRK